MFVGSNNHRFKNLIYFFNFIVDTMHIIGLASVSYKV
jgi:hypothetical protein